MELPDRITIDERGEAHVRDLPVKALKVYHDLAFRGTPESEVLHKYGLEPEDIAAVREYAVYSINTRTHDPITGRAILPKDQLRDGAYYKGRCRNATVARWNAKENQFYHWREKFERIYIETIRYPTDEVEPWWDVFDVVSELPTSPFEIPFDAEAAFCGNPADLTMYAEEMWGEGRNKHTVGIEAIQRFRDEQGNS